MYSYLMNFYPACSVSLLGNPQIIPFACRTTGNLRWKRVTSSGSGKHFLMIKSITSVTQLPQHCGGIHQQWKQPLKSPSQSIMYCAGSFCGCHGEHGQWILNIIIVWNGHYSKKNSCAKILLYFNCCSSKGLYKKSLRIVVDLRDSYYLATEELGCSNCGASFQCWDQR